MRLGGFDETFDACEDYDLWLRIAVDTPVLLISEPLFVKRGGTGINCPAPLGDWTDFVSGRWRNCFGSKVPCRLTFS